MNILALAAQANPETVITLQHIISNPTEPNNLSLIISFIMAMGILYLIARAFYKWVSRPFF